MLWPKINLGNIFQYILSTRDFDSDNIGKYEDQKAYSYFDSGFVGEIFIHEPQTTGNVKLVYCDVRASMSIHETKDLWIAIKDDTIITSWCSCMAGSSSCCNHELLHSIRLNMPLLMDIMTQHAHPSLVSGTNLQTKKSY